METKKKRGFWFHVFVTTNWPANTNALSIRMASNEAFPFAASLVSANCGPQEYTPHSSSPSTTARNFHSNARNRSCSGCLHHQKTTVVSSLRTLSLRRCLLFRDDNRHCCYCCCCCCCLVFPTMYAYHIVVPQAQLAVDPLLVPCA